MCKTNLERIKGFNVDEMANFLSFIDIDECSGVTTIGDDLIFLNTPEDIKEWLEKEAIDNV